MGGAGCLRICVDVAVGQAHDEDVMCGAGCAGAVLLKPVLGAGRLLAERGGTAPGRVVLSPLWARQVAVCGPGELCGGRVCGQRGGVGRARKQWSSPPAWSVAHCACCTLTRSRASPAITGLAGAQLCFS